MNQQRGDHAYCMTNESPNIASFAAYIPKCLLYPLVISYMDNEYLPVNKGDFP